MDFSSRVSTAVIPAWMAMMVLVASPLAWALPMYPEVRSAHRPADLTLLDRQGTPLQSIRTDPSARRLPWVALADFSPALRTAVVLAEDHRFHAHTGVDWSGLARSTWANLAGDGAKQGASTITMQLAGLIDTDHARPAKGRSVVGKLGQIAAARELETGWRKADILEAYLNRVPMRGELVGIPAASRVLLGKHPSGLDAAESALLAALVRGPWWCAAPARCCSSRSWTALRWSRWHRGRWCRAPQPAPCSPHRRTTRRTTPATSCAP
jgi:penicillin-binding protein 1C